MTSSGSTTITYVTPDHRYFMRRTKREIIDRIEQMTGQRFDFPERFRMLDMFKEELATLAMNAWHALPAPPDPVDVLVQIMKTEFDRQANDDGSAVFVSIELNDPADSVLDGTFDLRALARAIREGMLK